jgi:hypothetical protein
VAGSTHLPTRRSTALAAIGLAGLAAGSWFLWFRSQPQIGADREVILAVDALFTAVTARDARLLQCCSQRLQTLREAGKLPAGAADYLDGIARQAREGRWESAAERLYDFMQRQRPVGATPRQGTEPTRDPKGP